MVQLSILFTTTLAFYILQYSNPLPRCTPSLDPKCLPLPGSKQSSDSSKMSRIVRMVNLEWPKEIASPYHVLHAEHESQYSPSHHHPNPSTAHDIYRLKCDRQRPCSSCVKRGDGTPCTYAGALKDNRNRHVESKGSEAQLRLQKLEEMVTSLMQNTNDRSGHGANLLSNIAMTPPEMIDPSLKASPHSSSNEVPDTFLTSKGHLDDNDSGSRYLGATNWTTVLQNVGHDRFPKFQLLLICFSTDSRNSRCPWYRRRRGTSTKHLTNWTRHLGRSISLGAFFCTLQFAATASNCG